jgi:hypothetical protein
LVGRVEPFIMKKDVLYRMGKYNKLKWCLLTTQVKKVMKELHEGTIGGHFVTKITQFFKNVKY